MLKSKAWVLGVLVAVATGFPAPPAQASELVKLGKLLVTGKRTPTAEAKTAADKPTPTRQEAGNAAPERQPLPAPARLHADGMTDVHQADDWPERAVENRQASQPAADNVPRNGPATPQPSGGGTASMDAGF